jgi:predicted GNAT family N-acyltransferase
VTVERATDAEARADGFAVRRTVFVEEQGVDEDLEYDEHDDPDADAVHFVAYDGGDPVGAARLRTADGVAKAERVAVLRDRRGEGWGRRLMDAVEAAARERGLETIRLHAQTGAEAFYHRLGYETTSDVFLEADIPHVEMEKRL